MMTPADVKNKIAGAQRHLPESTKASGKHILFSQTFLHPSGLKHHLHCVMWHFLSTRLSTLYRHKYIENVKIAVQDSNFGKPDPFFTDIFYTPLG
jgi:hypothetical protein